GGGSGGGGGGRGRGGVGGALRVRRPPFGPAAVEPAAAPGGRFARRRPGGAGQLLRPRRRRSVRGGDPRTAAQTALDDGPPQDLQTGPARAGRAPRPAPRRGRQPRGPRGRGPSGP